MSDWVLVLTAAAGRGLSDTDVEAAAARIEGAGTPRRLGANGAEIPCPARPSLPTIAGVDANALPADEREKRALIADMDSTMIASECIDELAAEAGIGERVIAITERAMRGELAFEEALTERVALLEGLSADVLAEVWEARIRLNPGARTFVRTMAERGAVTALVSGGFTYYTERVAAACGFAEHRANRLEIVDGRLAGRVLPPILGREAKRTALDEITARGGFGAADVLAIGDGANDLAMIEAAGLGIGYRPKPLLAKASDAVLTHSDLTAALYLQGLEEHDFVTD